MKLDRSNAGRNRNLRNAEDGSSLEPTRERKRGQPQNTWLRDLEADVKETGYNWGLLERVAQVWKAWKNHVGDLSPMRVTVVLIDWLID